MALGENCDNLFLLSLLVYAELDFMVMENGECRFRFLLDGSDDN